MKKKWYVGLLIFCIALSFLLYGNTIRNDFVYDDTLFTYRTDTRSISSLARIFFQPYLPNNPQSGVWRPIATITTALQYITTGESPSWFHLTNIMLNGLVTFLVIILIYELFHQQSLAIITALLFAFFPIHTEAVAFIKSREDLFASVFFLLSWILFLLATRIRPIKTSMLILSAGIFLLSVLSKETFIAAPLLFIVVYTVQHELTLKNILQLIPYYLIPFAFYVLTRYLVLSNYAFGSDNSSYVINPLRFVDVWTRIWTAFQIAFIYIKTVLFPIHLSASYHFNQVPLVHNPLESLQSISGIILLTGFIFLSVTKRLKKTPIGIGAIIFLVSYFVISKFLFTAGEIMAERWMYIPSLGLALITAYLIHCLIKRHRSAGLLILCVILLWYTSIIIPRNRVWFSKKTLYESMTRDSPRSAQAHYLLGSLYFYEKNYALAKQEIDKASSIYPDYAPILTLQGDLSVMEGKYSEAEDYLLKATRLDASSFRSFVDLANVYYLTGKFTEAVKYYEALVPKAFGRLAPENFLAYATSLTKLGKYRESINIINENIPKNDMSEVSFILAVNLYKLGEIDLAKKYLNWNSNLTEEQKIEMIRTFH